MRKNPKVEVRTREVILLAQVHGMTVSEAEAADWLERNRAEIEAQLREDVHDILDARLKWDLPEVALSDMVEKIEYAVEEAVETYAEAHKTETHGHGYPDDADQHRIAREFISARDGSELRASTCMDASFVDARQKKHFLCTFALAGGKVTAALVLREARKDLQ